MVTIKCMTSDAPIDFDSITEPGDIDRLFPGWHAFKGVNSLWYVRLVKSSPPQIFRDQTLPGLAKRIDQWQSEQESVRIPLQRTVHD